MHARIDDARGVSRRGAPLSKKSTIARTGATDDIDAETRISRIKRRRQRQQRVWFAARKRTPQRASSFDGPSSLGLGISIARLFSEASRAKSISFSSYVRSSFDPASMSRRTFSTSDASGSDTVETQHSSFERKTRATRRFVRRLGTISIRSGLSRRSSLELRLRSNVHEYVRRVAIASSASPSCLPFCGRCVNADAISTLL